MPDPEDYVYCNNEREVHAGDRFLKRGWWTETLGSEGLCTYGVCGAKDVRAWFAAADAYIKKQFKPHLERFQNQIAMKQGAPNAEQAQIIQEAQKLLDRWSVYAQHYRTGGGGPVGETFKSGGYRWEDSGDADPGGPSESDFFWVAPLTGGDVPFELSKEIATLYYNPAACLRDKFNYTKPEGMLGEIPEYGSVTTRPEGERQSEGIGPLGMIGIGLGLWVALKALSD